jgi:putative ABC transport system permease protein
MILWKLSWSNIRRHRIRSLLTVLSIAAGVAAVVAVLQTTATTRGRLRQLQKAVAPRAALEVVAAEGGPFAQRLAEPVPSLPGVKSAVYSLRQFTAIHANEQHVRGAALGVELQQFRLVRDFEMVAGRGYSQPGELCLEASVADKLGVGPGDSVRVLTRISIRPIPHQVTGVLRLRGAGALEETAGVFLPLQEVQRLWRAPGEVDRVQVILKEGAPTAQAEAELSRRLPDSLSVRNVTSRADLGEGTATLVNQGLNVAGALSIIAAMFIVLNTFMMSIAERRKHLAILRVIGATARQIRAMLLQESLLVSVLGTIAGVAAGTTAGMLLIRGMGELFQIQQTPVMVGATPVLCGLVFGPLITLAAVAYPAREAGRVEPLAALRPILAANNLRRRRLLFLFAGLVLMISLGAIAAAVFEVAPPALSIPGFCFFVVSCVLLVPALLRPGSYAVYRLLRGLLPAEALLAQRQLMQNLSRSTLTVGALFVVTCTGVGVASTILAVVNDVDAWFERTLVGDFLLRASYPRINPADGEPAPSNVESEIRELPGVAGVDRVTFLSIKANDLPAMLLVREFSQYQGLPLDLKEGDAADVRGRLLSGEAVVASVLARQLNVSAGDSVTLEAGGEDHVIRVAGIVGEYTSSGNVIEMDRQAAQRLFPITQTHAFLIKCEPDAAEQVAPALEELAQKNELLFQSLSEFRQSTRAMLSGVTSGMWLLLALSLLVAAFGVVNTLTMNVLEQTQYIGLLRVIGMTRRQVRRTILCQALMIGALALIPGILVGVVLAFAITFVFRGLFGHAIAFELHPALLGVYLSTGLALMIIVAAIPARRAARLELLVAIHEE